MWEEEIQDREALGKHKNIFLLNANSLKKFVFLLVKHFL